jgi:hypothetical protein
MVIDLKAYLEEVLTTEELGVGDTAANKMFREAIQRTIRELDPNYTPHHKTKEKPYAKTQ